jgi:hypothetical protein
MKKPILSLVIIILLSGCGLLQINENNFENDPIYHDLLDRNNTFLGITPGKSKLPDAVEILESYAKGESVFHESENQGVFEINYINSYLQGVLLSYVNNQITRVNVRLTDSIAIETILSKLGTDFKLSAYVLGLHESQLSVDFIYAEMGIDISLEFLPIENTNIYPDTEVFVFSFYEEQKTFIVSDSLFIDEYDVACAREWQGYGNVMEIYYPDATGTSCPYWIP